MKLDNQGLHFEKRIDITEQLVYQKGYHDGYIEGFNKAFETFYEELKKCRLQRPVEFYLNTIID